MTDAPTPWGRLKRAPWWVLGDIAALAVLFGFRAWLQPRWAMGHAGEGAPAWASQFDLYLSGPDAGPWAAAARGLAGGNLADIDPHRMPTWTILTAIVMWLGLDDVVLAGHLVNHLVSFTFIAAIYALGRRAGLGGLAFAAAAAATATMHMAFTASHFGIDAFVAMAVPLLLVTASFAGKARWVAVVAGVIGGMCAIGHLSTLGFPICGALLAAALAEPGKRAVTAGLYLAGVVAAVVAVFSWYPTIPTSELLTVFAEGIVQKNTANPDQETALRHLADAAAVVVGGLGTAVTDVVTRVLPTHKPRLIPWALALLLPWIGIWGPGLAKGSLKTRQAWLGSLVTGLPLATALAPLVALAAAQAEDRYLYNFAPLYLLFLFRGLASIFALVERALPTWATGVLGIVVGAVVGVDVLRDPPLGMKMVLTPAIEPGDRVQMDLGRDLATLPERTYVISLQREALAYAGLRQCLLADCPSEASTAAFEGCITEARQDCPGEGPILYLVEGRPDPRRVPEPRIAMDLWALQSFPVDHQVQTHNETITFLHIPRQP
ncbi:MAG: hypothetical protein GY913_24025 [Proteobacteria bacterium]|nr:hypothetical protein [Pseudomonadota bacterium]